MLYRMFLAGAALAVATLFLAGCEEETRARPAAARCSDTCEVAGGTECREPGYRTCDDFDGDGCIEWSEVSPCERACIGGRCVDCANDCAEGNQKCGPTGGIQQCVADVDDDPCLEWGAEETCPEGQTCSVGRCREGCVDECAEVGAKQCVVGENGTQVCQESDADDCLHWGAVVACEAGQTCSNGECRAGCVDECEANSVRCAHDGFQTCGKFDDDACLEWSAVTPCEGAQVCSNGECADTCANECNPEGQRQCSGNGFVVCGNHDEDDCLEWGGLNACEGTQTCSGGRCREGCVNECAEDTKQCSGNGAQTCGQYDDDECLEWSAIVPCDQGESCSNGECATRCTNECGALNQRQCSGNGYQVCGNHDDDACLEWGVVSACPAGQACANGECAERCANACAEDSKQCQGNGVQTCGNFNEDPCLEWGAVAPCPDGQTCSGGVCNVACGDECVRGNTRCAPGGVQTCGNFDDDECSDWGAAAPCAEGEFCSNGECAVQCNDECARGAKRCSAIGFLVCG